MRNVLNEADAVSTYWRLEQIGPSGHIAGHVETNSTDRGKYIRKTSGIKILRKISLKKNRDNRHPLSERLKLPRVHR